MDCLPFRVHSAFRNLCALIAEKIELISAGRIEKYTVCFPTNYNIQQYILFCSVICFQHHSNKICVYHLEFLCSIHFKLLPY